MKIGIIGFGRLGSLISRNLAQDFDVYVYDRVDHSEAIIGIGAKVSTLAEVCACPVVIPFVPISEFESVVKQMASHLSDETLVVDVCSVKKYPVQIMQEQLPEGTQILGTHPMFGPDSASDTLYGNKIVLCPVRIKENKLEQIKNYLERFGLKVIQATPDEHDKQISSSLLLTHFIGRTLMEFGAGPLEIDTKGHRRLMKILETVENDTWQLFNDMNHYNPFAQETISKFIDSFNKIYERVK